MDFHICSTWGIDSTRNIPESPVPMHPTHTPNNFDRFGLFNFGNVSSLEPLHVLHRKDPPKRFKRMELNSFWTQAGCANPRLLRLVGFVGLWVVLAWVGWVWVGSGPLAWLAWVGLRLRWLVWIWFVLIGLGWLGWVMLGSVGLGRVCVSCFALDWVGWVGGSGMIWLFACIWVGWVGSCRVRSGHAGSGWVMLGNSGFGWVRLASAGWGRAGLGGVVELAWVGCVAWVWLGWIGLDRGGLRFRFDWVGWVGLGWVWLDSFGLRWVGYGKISLAAGASKKGKTLLMIGLLWIIDSAQKRHLHWNHIYCDGPQRKYSASELAL